MPAVTEVEGVHWCRKRLVISTESCSYHEAFIHNNHLCIITEFCDKGDLHSVISQRASTQEHFSEDEVMEMFVQILLGVAHIHNNRIVHRDLKV